jgi:23S rRNA pseudouridine1911/1915/1917 synthase
MPTFPVKFTSVPDDAGQRLDQYLVSKLPEISRSRIQQLIETGSVLVEGSSARASLRLKGGEEITLTGPPQPPPLRALAEQIPLDIIYEDSDIAVINKPAGMMVHAGAGATEDARNRGTLVNALLHHFGTLSEVGGELRPGIVHRLDRATSGLMVVAKNDEAHRKLAKQFSSRQVHKTYLALVQGWPKQERGTIRTSISRDSQRRIRMTTGRPGGREAVTHYRVMRKLDTVYGKFALLEVKIETGRTHQIRVHLASIHHPVVGDTLYGAAGELKSESGKVRGAGQPRVLALDRNFLHSAALELQHPRSGEPLRLDVPLPNELQSFLSELGEGGAVNEARRVTRVTVR